MRKNKNEILEVSRKSFLDIHFSKGILTLLIPLLTLHTIIVFANQKKENKPKKIGKETYTTIEVNLDGGLLTEKYLPFDVPFFLIGKVPKNVHRIAVIYGESSNFEHDSSVKDHKADTLRLDTLAKIIKKITDPIGSISFLKKNFKFAIWDKTNLEKKNSNDTKIKDSFALEISPLKANQNYRFFLHFYSEKNDDLIRQVTEWLTKQSAKIGNDIISNERSEKSNNVDHFSKLFNNKRVHLEKKLISYINKELYHKSLNISHFPNISSEVKFDSILKNLKVGQVYAERNRNINAFNSFEKEREREEEINKLLFGESGLIDGSNRFSQYRGVISEKHLTFFQNIYKIVKDSAYKDYRSGRKSFATNLIEPDPFRKIQNAMGIDSMQKNLEEYGNKIKELSEECRDLGENNYLLLQLVNLEHLKKTKKKKFDQYSKEFLKKLNIDIKIDGLLNLEKVIKTIDYKIDSINIVKEKAVNNFSKQNSPFYYLKIKIKSARSKIENLEAEQISLKYIDKKMKIYKLSIENSEEKIVKEKDADKRSKILETIKKQLDSLLVFENQKKEIENKYITGIEQAIGAEKEKLDSTLLPELNEKKVDLSELITHNRQAIDNIKVVLEKCAMELTLISEEILNDKIRILTKYKKNLEKSNSLWNGVSKELVKNLEYSEFFQVAGSSNNDFLTRAEYYISADIGIAYLNFGRKEPGVITPYFGVNFNLFPINRQAHYNLFPLKKTKVFHGLSIMVGLTFIDFNKSPRDHRSSIFGDKETWKNINLITGMALRLSDYSRISAGSSWTYLDNHPDLVTDKTLNANWFISLSIDFDVKKHLGTVGNLFNTPGTPL